MLYLGGSSAGKALAMKKAREAARRLGVEVQVYGPKEEPTEPLKGIPFTQPPPWMDWEYW